MEKIIGKYKVEVIQDEFADGPDSWKNTDAFVVYDHRDFYVKREGFDPREIFEHIEHTKRIFYNGHFVFPLYAYIHSGVTLSVDDHNFPDALWDVSTTGWVLVKREKEMYRRAKALNLAKGIVEDWNMYLSGDVYGYKVTDTETDEEIDSCWGFYGDEESCMTEAENVATYQIEEDKHGQLELELK